MRSLSNAHHFRKTVAGTCMVFGPLLALVSGIVQPDPKLDEAQQLAVVAGHMDAWYVAQLIGLVAIVLAVPAVLGLMHMLREREVAWGHIGGGLAMLGLLGYTGIVTMGLVQWQMAATGNTGQMTDLLHRMNHTTGMLLPFAIGAVAFGVGMVCLAIGLYRARVVQSWMALAVAVAATCIVVAGFTASALVFIVGTAFLVVGLGSIGRMVLTESDADWEHTPEYRGFRPLAGMR
jgi:Domain of unknown function (DUF4386)